MIECLVMGDGIAVGISKYRPECSIEAKVGINSPTWLKQYDGTLNKTFNVVVISLGTTDYHNTTKPTLHIIRKRIQAGMVIWILPSYTLKPVQRKIISDIAREYGDRTLDITKYVGFDGYHPLNYKPVADLTKDTK